MSPSSVSADTKPAEAAPSSLPPELVALNAELRRGAVHEQIAGLEVDDPYRALEAESPATTRWIDAQTARTEAALAAAHEPKDEARLRALLSIGSIGSLGVGGKRVFFTLRTGERDRPALYVMDASAAASGKPRALPSAPAIDPASYGDHAALDYIFPSQDGRFVAFGVADNGDERATLRVYDVEHGTTLSDALTHAKWTSIGWLPDSSGFFYSRYPVPGEPNYDARAEDTYYNRVFFHALGSDQKKDVLVFQSPEPTAFPSAQVDETGRYVVFNLYRTWTATDVWLWDRGAKASARGVTPKDGELRAVVLGEDKVTTGEVRGGLLFLLTSLDAPRKRVVRIELARATGPNALSDRKRWQVIVPESGANLDSAAISSHAIALHAIEDVQSQLVVYAPDGKALGTAALPTRGSIDELAAPATGTRIAFVWSSFFHPPAIYVYDTRTRALEQLYQVENDLDTSAFELERTQVPSKDGTLVNVHYVHRKGLVRDGNAPVLIDGYGGFDVSLLPEFERSPLYFVELGGIYAVANLRGGGEYGEQFHRAGMLANKPRVFEDFEAVIGWFGGASGYSNPSRIAITGGSNGGLLMGAMLTRIPDEFRAATSYVGLYDMLRYAQFPPAALWTSEYGDPKDPEAARYLLAYSPYHQVRDGTAYPAALIETADHDTRVFYGHSTKFAARLQDANRGPNPVYFYMERAIGHGHGTGLADLIRRESRRYAFLRAQLRL